MWFPAPFATVPFVFLVSSLLLFLVSSVSLSFLFSSLSSVPFSFCLYFHPSLPHSLGPSLISLQTALPAQLVQSEPSAAPGGVSCESASSTSLRVSWKPPPLEGQNGVLAGYELSYQRVSGAGGEGQGREVKGSPIPAEHGQTVVEELEKWSWYSITLAASTAEGTGPKSPAVLCRTDEDGECTVCKAKSWSLRLKLNSIDHLADHLLTGRWFS